MGGEGVNNLAVFLESQNLAFLQAIALPILLPFSLS